MLLDNADEDKIHAIQRFGGKCALGMIYQRWPAATQQQEAERKVETHHNISTPV